jgi:hypothetical protein
MLADIDGISVGVSAAKMGVPVFAKAGFVEQERIQVEAYNLPRDSVVSLGTTNQSDKIEAIELWIGIRPPTGSQHPTTTSPPQKTMELHHKPLWTFVRAWNRAIGP